MKFLNFCKFKWNIQTLYKIIRGQLYSVVTILYIQAVGLASLRPWLTLRLRSGCEWAPSPAASGHHNLHLISGHPRPLPRLDGGQPPYPHLRFACAGSWYNLSSLLWAFCISSVWNISYVFLYIGLLGFIYQSSQQCN